MSDEVQSNSNVNERVFSNAEELNSAFVKAARDGDIEFVKKALDKDPSIVHAISSRDFRRAVSVENIEIVKLLIDAGVKPDRESLDRAASEESMELVELFLSLGADKKEPPPPPDSEMIIAAVENGQKEVVHALLDKDPS